MSGNRKYVLWLCSLPGLGNVTLYRLWKESGEDPDFAEKLYVMAGRQGNRENGTEAEGQGNRENRAEAEGIGNRENEAEAEGIGNRENEAEAERRAAGPGSQKFFDILRRGKRSCFPDQLERKLQEKGIYFVWAGDADFPRRLRNIPDPPFALYYRGRLPQEEGTSVGIVGARMASPYGREQARRFAAGLAAGGIQIISGMARGVDGIAGRGALEVSDASFAVLGCGVDICYPKENRDLYEALCRRGGVLSEYRPGTEPEARLFPPRNRIISALSDALLVVEARERSGTLITVDCALEQGKDVFAVPGRVCDAKSAGCNELIRQGAGIAVSPESLLEELAGGREEFTERSGAGKCLEQTERGEHVAILRTGETGSAVPGKIPKPEEEKAEGKSEGKGEGRSERIEEKREEALPALSELERSILRSLDASTAKSVDEILPEVNRRMHEKCTFPAILRAVMKLSAAGYVRELRVGKYISCCHL